MNDWWQGLETREQRVLMTASILCAAMLFYSLAWIPLVDSRDQKRTHVENNQELLGWINTKSTEVKQLRQTSPSIRKSDTTRSLLAVVDSMAKQLGIRGSINRIDPDGPHSATIWIDNMNFDVLVTLLGNLDKRNGVTVKDAELSKQNQPGNVKARIVLERT